MSSSSDPEPTPPAVDERLVAPGSRYEIEDGRVAYVPPADEPHGVHHAELAALVRAHRADGFAVAVDMLTRLTCIDDIAPDVSVYPAARHAQTGGRQLEHLAFEVLAHAVLAVLQARGLAPTDSERQHILGETTPERLERWAAAAATCASVAALFDR